jgi:hypothetical protein
MLTEHATFLRPAAPAVLVPSRDPDPSTSTNRAMWTLEDHPTEPVEDHPTESVEDHPTEPVEDHPTESVEDHPTEPVEDHPTEPVDDHTTEPMTDRRTGPMTDRRTGPMTDHRTEPVSNASSPRLTASKRRRRKGVLLPPRDFGSSFIRGVVIMSTSKRRHAELVTDYPYRPEQTLGRGCSREAWCLATSRTTGPAVAAGDMHFDPGSLPLPGRIRVYAPVTSIGTHTFKMLCRRSLCCVDNTRDSCVDPGGHEQVVVWHTETMPCGTTVGVMDVHADKTQCIQALARQAGMSLVPFVDEVSKSNSTSHARSKHTSSPCRWLPSHRAEHIPVEATVFEVKPHPCDDHPPIGSSDHVRRLVVELEGGGCDRGLTPAAVSEYSYRVVGQVLRAIDTSPTETGVRSSLADMPSLMSDSERGQHVRQCIHRLPTDARAEPRQESTPGHADRNAMDELEATLNAFTGLCLNFNTPDAPDLSMFKPE